MSFSVCNPESICVVGPAVSLLITVCIRMRWYYAVTTCSISAVDLWTVLIAGLQCLLHFERWPVNVDVVSVESGQWSLDDDWLAADQWDVHNRGSGIYRHRGRSAVGTNACTDTAWRSVAEQGFCFAVINLKHPLIYFVHDAHRE